jgi:hypothetical protein
LPLHTAGFPPVVSPGRGFETKVDGSAQKKGECNKPAFLEPWLYFPSGSFSLFLSQPRLRTCLPPIHDSTPSWHLGASCAPLAFESDANSAPGRLKAKPLRAVASRRRKITGGRGDGLEVWVSSRNSGDITQQWGFQPRAMGISRNYRVSSNAMILTNNKGLSTNAWYGHPCQRKNTELGA